MIPRRIRNEVEAALNENPAVALLGPRQVGKTTLAIDIGQSRQAVYLDLEDSNDRSRLAFGDGNLWAIEIKRSLAAKVERGFYQAITDLKPARSFVVHAGTDVRELARMLAAL